MESDQGKAVATQISAVVFFLFPSLVGSELDEKKKVVWTSLHHGFQMIDTSPAQCLRGEERSKKGERVSTNVYYMRSYEQALRGSGWVLSEGGAEIHD
jgi:hypothetical protein